MFRPFFVYPLFVCLSALCISPSTGGGPSGSTRSSGSCLLPSGILDFFLHGLASCIF